MKELKEYLIDQMIYYKKKHDDLLYDEHTILEMDDETMENLTLYEGILEGIAIALEKLKQIQSK